MGWMARTTIFAALAGASLAAHAASADMCASELTAIVAPALPDLASIRGSLHVELAEAADGGYVARVSATTANPGTPNRDGTFGWVRLDTRAMKVLDITRDPDHPDVLAVDAARYRRYVDTCLDLDPDVKQMCDALNREVPRDAAHVPPAHRMVVTGSGRLPFYSAPDASCPMRGVFILTREQVDSRRQQGAFSEVEYTQARTGRVVVGWVQSERLRAADAASTAGAAPASTPGAAPSPASGP